MVKLIIKDILHFYELTGINNENVICYALMIVSQAYILNKKDIIISRTGDNELLIYRNVDGEIRNIIIDKDCDIEFLVATKIRKDSYHELYQYDELNNDIINKLIEKI